MALIATTDRKKNLTLRTKFYASINVRDAHPPGATAGGGWGICNFIAAPGAGRPPGVWHTCFRKTDKFIGKDQAFVKDWLVHQGLEKLVAVFKGMLSQF